MDWLYKGCEREYIYIYMIHSHCASIAHSFSCKLSMRMSSKIESVILLPLDCPGVINGFHCGHVNSQALPGFHTRIGGGGVEEVELEGCDRRRDVCVPSFTCKQNS